MALDATDLADSTLMCFYADGDASHPPARYRTHDRRGCVSTCEHCTRWRAGLSTVGGHGETCPDEGLLAD